MDDLEMQLTNSISDLKMQSSDRSYDQTFEGGQECGWSTTFPGHPMVGRSHLKPGSQSSDHVPTEPRRSCGCQSLKRSCPTAVLRFTIGTVVGQLRVEVNHGWDLSRTTVGQLCSVLIMKHDRTSTNAVVRLRFRNGFYKT